MAGRYTRPVRFFFKGRKRVAKNLRSLARTCIGYVNDRQTLSGVKNLTRHFTFPDGTVFRIQKIDDLVNCVIDVPLLPPGVSDDTAVFLIYPNDAVCRAGWGGPDEFDEQGNFIGMGTCGVGDPEQLMAIDASTINTPDENDIVNVNIEFETNRIHDSQGQPLYYTTTTGYSPSHFAHMHDWRGADGTVIHIKAYHGRYDTLYDGPLKGPVYVNDVAVTLEDDPFIYGAWKFNNRLVICTYSDSAYRLRSYEMDGTDGYDVDGSDFADVEGSILGQLMWASPSGSKAVTHNRNHFNIDKNLYDIEDLYPVERTLIELEVETVSFAKMVATVTQTDLTLDAETGVAYKQQCRIKGDCPSYSKYSIDSPETTPNDWDGATGWDGTISISQDPQSLFAQIWEVFVPPGDFVSWVFANPNPLASTEFNLVLTDSNSFGQYAGYTTILSDPYSDKCPPAPQEFPIECAASLYSITDVISFSREYNKSGGGTDTYNFTALVSSYDYYHPYGWLIRQEIERYQHYYFTEDRMFVGIDWRDVTDELGNDTEEMVECYLTGMGNVNPPSPPGDPGEALSPQWPFQETQQDMYNAYPPRTDEFFEDYKSGEQFNHYSGFCVYERSRKVNANQSFLSGSGYNISHPDSSTLKYENFTVSDKVRDRFLNRAAYSGEATLWMVFEGEISGEISRHPFLKASGLYPPTGLAAISPFNTYWWPAPEVNDTITSSGLIDGGDVQYFPYGGYFSDALNGGDCINTELWAIDIRNRTWIQTRMDYRISHEVMNKGSEWGLTVNDPNIDPTNDVFDESGTRVFIRDNFIEMFYEGTRHVIKENWWANAYSNNSWFGHNTFVRVNGWIDKWIAVDSRPASGSIATSKKAPVYAHIATSETGVTLCVLDIHDITLRPDEQMLDEDIESELTWFPFTIDEKPDSGELQTAIQKFWKSSAFGYQTSFIGVFNEAGTLLGSTDEVIEQFYMNAVDPDTEEPLFKRPSISPIRATKIVSA